MCEKYRTIGRAWFYSLTEHALQHFTMCKNESSVFEFPRWPMIVSLYDYSISNTYSFILALQSIMVTSYKKENAIN